MEEHSSPWFVSQKFPSTVDNAVAVMKDLRQHLKRLDWPENDKFAILIAMEEALMNAVKHGNQYDESKSVDLKIELNQNDFYARIGDDGDGFNLNDVPDPCEDCNLEKPSGRGVALIKNFVDHVAYNDSGNVIEFQKQRSSK